MSGYDLDKSDLQKIPSKYICSSCDKLLNDPVQTRCGHFYCSSCVEDLRESNHSLRCKKDKQWLTDGDLFPDKAMERELLELPVNCPQKPCTWRGKLRDLQNHLWQCAYILIPCMFDCGEMVKESDVGRHHEECKMVNRESRKQAGSSSGLSSFHSISVFSSLRGSAGGCFFESLGCKVPKTLTVQQLKEHNIKCIGYHIGLLLEYIQKLEQQMNASLTQTVQNLTEQISDQARKIQHLENVTRGLWGFDVEALLRRLINAENMNADLGVLIVELNSNIEELRKKVLQHEKQQENQNREISALKTRDQDQASGSRSVDEHFKLLSMISFDGVLVWKITDVARKRNDARTDRTVAIYSPPFYTDRYGYKMCARLYLNGDGMGRGQCLSLFFVVMRGEYDGLLRWPFRNKVTMMLLDQNHVEHVIDSFKPDPSSSSFQRPRNEMNIASGCPMFCPLDDLEKHGYVKDDTMFIKIIVDTSDCF